MRIESTDLVLDLAHHSVCEFSMSRIEGPFCTDPECEECEGRAGRWAAYRIEMVLEPSRRGLNHTEITLVFDEEQMAAIAALASHTMALKDAQVWMEALDRVSGGAEECNIVVLDNEGDIVEGD